MGSLEDDFTEYPPNVLQKLPKEIADALQRLDPDDPNRRRLIEEVQRLAELLDEPLDSPICEPPPDLVSRTLQRLTWETAAESPTTLPAGRLVSLGKQAARSRLSHLVVDICLPDSEVSTSDGEKVECAVHEFLGVVGYELRQTGDPEQGSWYRRLHYTLKGTFRFGSWFWKLLSRIKSTYQHGVTFTRRVMVGIPGAERELKLAKAANNIISSLDSIDNACIRMGEILIIKSTKRGKTHLIIERLSSDLADDLDARPFLLRNPDLLLKWIEKCGATTGINGGGAATG